MKDQVVTPSIGRLAVLAAFAVAAILAASLAPRAAFAGCAEDAAGMCERPIACNPPQGGKCTTVAIPQPLTGHKFECRCLAATTSAAVCLRQCSANRRQCDLHVAAPQRGMCAQQFERCELGCERQP